MAEDKDPITDSKIVRVKFKGIAEEKFISPDAKEKYTAIFGKPDFIMVSYVRMVSGSPEEIDTYIVREDEKSTGMIITNQDGRTKKAKKLIEELGGEVVGK